MGKGKVTSGPQNNNACIRKGRKERWSRKKVDVGQQWLACICDDILTTFGTHLNNHTPECDTYLLYVKKTISAKDYVIAEMKRGFIL